MAAYQYIRWFPSDYLRDTRRLTFEEHGAYLLLLNEYYLTGEPLPDDDEWFLRTLSVSLSVWRKLRPAVAKHFCVENGLWKHSRCEKELLYARSTRAARVAGAEKTNAQRVAQRVAQRDLSDPQPEPEPYKVKDMAQKAAPSVRFKRPSFEEIKDYFVSNDSSIREAEKFEAYYEGNGWKVGKNAMKSWHGSAKGWILRNNERSNGTVHAEPPLQPEEEIPSLRNDPEFIEWQERNKRWEQKQRQRPPAVTP